MASHTNFYAVSDSTSIIYDGRPIFNNANMDAGYPASPFDSVSVAHPDPSSTVKQVKRPAYLDETEHTKQRVHWNDQNYSYLPPKGFSTSKKKHFTKSTKLLGSISLSKLFNQRFVRQNKKEIIGWCLLVALIIVGYKFFSDGSFSAILTLASAFQCFSMMLLNLKVISQQSTAGVSRRSVALIVICLIFRLLSTIYYNGYLPVDRSGDWLYQGADVISALLGIILLIYSHYRCVNSILSQIDKDTTYILTPAIAAFILAILIHPNLNKNILPDTCWTFALYLETYAMVPQLFMMGKLGGEVEALTSHYVASMALSKIFNVLFWYFSYAELAPHTGGYNFAGYAVIISYSIQALLFADFLYYYVKSLRIGRKMIIHF